MLEIQAILTYFHFIGIIFLFTSLTIELILFKPVILNASAKYIRAFDAVYGIVSLLIFATGALKAVEYGKGLDYYISNHLMWGKLILFTLIGLLSIYPTITFLKWKNEVKAGNDITLEEKQYKLIKRIIHIELAIACFIPLFAVFMARGFGYVN